MVLTFAALALAAFTPLTGEIPVNTTTEDFQYVPRVIESAGGGFLVVWEDELTDNGEIRARRFSAAGAPLGGEIPINATTALLQELPDVDTGVVVWESPISETIVARRIDAAAQPVGGEITVNTSLTGIPEDASVATSPDGSFTVAWSHDPTGLLNRVLFRRFNAAGTPLTGEIAVASGFEEGLPDVAAHLDGSITVAWDSSEGADELGVYARRYSAAGAPLGPIRQLNSTTAGTQQAPELAADAGGFTAAWTSDGDAVARRFDTAGNPLTPEVNVSLGLPGTHGAPSVSTEPDGDAVIAWTGPSDGSVDAAWVRHYTAAMTPTTDPTIANVYTDSLQIANGVATGADGFTVVWQSFDQDGDGEGVYARRFRADGGSPPPPPPPPPPPSPDPPAPPAPPGADPLPPLPAFSKVVVLPSNRRCVSRRRFRIRIREPGAIDIARATVVVNGKRVATRRGRRVTAPIDLRGLPKGRYRVQITVVTTDGRTLRGTRRYRTCVPKRRGGKPEL